MVVVVVVVVVVMVVGMGKGTTRDMDKVIAGEDMPPAAMAKASNPNSSFIT